MIKLTKNKKSCHILSIILKCVFVKYEKYGTLSINKWPLKAKSYENHTWKENKIP